MRPSQPLTGRTALVTGGSRGIGAAIADVLAEDGADVWIVGRDESALAAVAEQIGQTHRVSARWLACDVTDPSAIQRMIDVLLADGGGLDILVNNAGAAESAPFGALDDAGWERMIATNLTSVYRVSRALLPLIRTKGNDARIVNIASTAGLTGFPYVTAYCAAKHGVVGLTRALAAELAREGITVNAICPGYTDTELVDQAVATINRHTGLADNQVRETLIRDVPIGRYIRPEEVAAAVRWICCADAAGVTGTAIPVAGGAVN